MTSTTPTRILVVTTDAQPAPELLAAIAERAAKGDVRFRVLVPNPAPAEWHPMHPERHDKAAAAEAVLAEALPALTKAAGGPVVGSVSIRHDAMDAVEAALRDEPFDEIMLTKVHLGLERWLHLDLPHRLAHLGLPVTMIDSEVPATGVSGVLLS